MKHDKQHNENFQSIYEQYWKSLYISAYKILRNESDARLVVKDVFITFFKNGELLQKESELENFLFLALQKRVLLQISTGNSYIHLLESLGSYLSVLDHEDHPEKEKGYLKCTFV